MVLEGYKETEIGVIPIEWEVKQLDEIVIFKNGKGHEQVIDENGQYIVINSKFISTDGKMYKSSNSNLSPLKTDDIAMVMSDIPNGKALAKYFYVDKDNKYTLNQRICSLTAIKDNPLFLFYRLNRNRYFLKFNDGVNQTNLRKNEVLECKIPLPPLKEQEKIADILSTADEKIDAIASQIQKVQTLKKGLLQKLLSEGIGHSEFKDSELGKIPESWEVVELGSCVNGKGNYGIGAAAVNYDENLPTYLRITDIDNNGNFISSNKKCVDSPDTSNYQLEDGDIVFARTGNTTGKTYLYNPDDGVLIYAGFLIKFTPNKEVLNTYYLKLQASTERYWNWVKVTSMRTGQPGINSEEYSKFIFPLPPLEEQKQIADILSTADEKLEVLRAKKEKYETLKKGLLQKLLSGEVRV